MTLQIEIHQLWVYMTAALAAPTTLLKTRHLAPMVDLFAPQEYQQPSHGKRPCIDDDPEAVPFHTGLTEEEELKLALRE